MILWRISNHTALDGRGGLLASARWHTRGRRVVYCAPSPAAALIEMLVHLEGRLDTVPLGLQYLEISGPNLRKVERVDARRLPSGWRTSLDATRRIGDEWLRSARSLLLMVPSVIVPETWNTLINPDHPDRARFRVARIHAHDLDERLR